MAVHRFVIDPRRVNPADLGAPARLLRQGALVAFPTETVYGLGARANDEESVRSIFAVKGRPSTNPVIVHVATIAQARVLCADWDDRLEGLARTLWPGPITLVVPRADDVPDAVTAGGATIGIRIPDHPIALPLLRLAGVPVAAPSANRSGSVSPTEAEHVFDDLGDDIDAIVDGGPCRFGLESTVVSLVGTPRVLRAGAYPLAQLRAHLPELAPYAPLFHDDGAAEAPGQSRRHYAPRARLVFAETPGNDGVLAAGPAANERGNDGVLRITLPDDPVGYAAGLYAALRRFDAFDVGCVFVERLPGEAGWEAIRDRLNRAATR